MKILKAWTSRFRNLTFCLFGGLALVGACVVEEEQEEEDAPECGDNKLNGTDECDNNDFGDASCATVGFEEGTLWCDQSCKIDSTLCVIVDEDQDALSIYDEWAYGTDPLNPDTDGDGLWDGDEVQNGSNPIDWTSWPGEIGKWPNHLQLSIDAGLAPTGLEVGDVIADRAWTDQWGQPVNLHQFYGYVTVLTAAARWCPPCQEASQTAQALLSGHLPQGVVFIEQLVEGNNPGTAATQDDVGLWANTYGLQYPVVFSANSISTPALPTYFIIDREMRIRNVIEGYPGDQNLGFYINQAVKAADEPPEE